MAIVVPIESVYSDQGVKAAQASIAGAAGDFEASAGRFSGAFEQAAQAVGDAFRIAGQAVGDAAVAAGQTIIAGGSVADAWNAAADQLGQAVGQIAASIAETVIAQNLAAAASKAWAAAQWLLNAALTANPIGLVIAAIVALIAIIVLAYKKSDTFRAIVTAAWAAIKAATASTFAFIGRTISAAWKIITTLFKLTPIGLLIANFDKLKAAVGVVAEAVSSAWEKAWAILQRIFDKIRAAIDKVRSAFDFLPSIPGISSSIAGAESQPFSSSRASAVSGTVTNINVTGALDPEATARAIQNTLYDHAARQGRTVNARRALAW